MTLRELHGEIENGKWLHFDCPCGCKWEGTPQRISIPFRIGEPPGDACVWSATGSTIDDITIRPSIWFLKGEGVARGEWHGFVENGATRPA